MLQEGIFCADELCRALSWVLYFCRRVSWTVTVPPSLT